MFHEEDIFGAKTDNGTWTGMIGRVSSGVSDIGVGPAVVTRDKIEVVALTEKLGTSR